MASSDNAATGGMLVILGIIVAIAIGFVAYRSGIFGEVSSGPSIKVELPNVTK